MKTSLLELIPELSPDEVREVRHQLSQYSSKRSEDLMALFDIMENVCRHASGTAYSHSQLKTLIQEMAEKEITDTTFTGQLNYWSHDLFDKITSSLGHYYANRVPKLAFLNMQRGIYFLLEKGLWPQALKEIKRAEKFAEKHDFNIGILELEFLRRTVTYEFIEKQQSKRLKESRSNYGKALEKLNLEARLLEKYEAFLEHDMRIKEAPWPERLVGEIRASIPQQKKEANKRLTFNAHFCYHYSLYWYNKKKDLDTAQQHIEEIIQLFKEKPIRKRTYQKRYISILTNYFNLRMDKREQAGMEEAIQLLKNFKPSGKHIKRVYEIRYLYLKHMLLITTQQYEEVKKIESEIRRIHTDYQGYIPKVLRRVFACNLAFACLINGELEKVHYWKEKLLGRNKSKFRIDIYLLSLLMEVMWLFESGNEDTGISYANNLARYIYRHQEKCQDELSKAIQQTANTLNRFSSVDEKTQKKELRQLVSALERTHGMEEVVYWIRSRYLEPVESH